MSKDVGTDETLKTCRQLTASAGEVRSSSPCDGLTEKKTEPLNLHTRTRGGRLFSPLRGTRVKIKNAHLQGNYGGSVMKSCRRCFPRWREFDVLRRRPWRVDVRVTPDPPWNPTEGAIEPPQTPFRKTHLRCARYVAVCVAAFHPRNWWNVEKS